MDQKNFANTQRPYQPVKSHRKTMKTGGVFAAIGAIASAAVGMLMPAGGIVFVVGTVSFFLGIFSLLGAGDFGKEMESLFSDILSQPLIIVLGIFIHLVLLAVMITAVIFVLLMLKKKNENRKQSVVIGLISSLVILVAPHIATIILSIITYILDSEGLASGVNIIEFVFGMEGMAVAVYALLGGILWIGALVAGFIIRFSWVNKWAKTEPQVLNR